MTALLSALQEGTGLLVEPQGDRLILTQPADGVHLRFPSDGTFTPLHHGPPHTGGRLEPGGLEIWDGWLLFSPGRVGPGRRGLIPEGLPPLVSTRDLLRLKAHLEEARLTVPLEDGRIEGIHWEAASVLTGAREAGLEGADSLWSEPPPSAETLLRPLPNIL